MFNRSRAVHYPKSLICDNAVCPFGQTGKPNRLTALACTAGTGAFLRREAISCARNARDSTDVDQSKNDFLADLPHSSRAIAPTRRRDQPGRILRMPARRCRRLPIGQTPVRSRNPERVQANLSKGWQGGKPKGFAGPACRPDCRRLKSEI